MTEKVLVFIMLRFFFFLKDEIAMDYCARFENLQGELRSFVEDRLGMEWDEEKLPRRKGSFRKYRVHYSAYYGDVELKEMVRQAYQKEIASFGYTFQSAEEAGSTADSVLPTDTFLIDGGRSEEEQKQKRTPPHIPPEYREAFPHFFRARERRRREMQRRQQARRQNQQQGK